MSTRKTRLEALRKLSVTSGSRKTRNTDGEKSQMKFVRTFVLGTDKTSNNTEMILRKAFGKNFDSLNIGREVYSRSEVSLPGDGDAVKLNVVELVPCQAVLLGTSLFVSNYAIYVITVDIQALLEEEDGNEARYLSHWTWDISIHAPNSKVFVIGYGECSNDQMNDVADSITAHMCVEYPCHNMNEQEKISFYNVRESTSEISHFCQDLREACENTSFPGSRNVLHKGWMNTVTPVEELFKTKLFNKQKSISEQVCKHCCSDDIVRKVFQFGKDDKTWVVQDKNVIVPEIFLDTFQKFLNEAINKYLLVKKLKNQINCDQIRKLLPGDTSPEKFQKFCIEYKMFLPLDNDAFYIPGLIPNIFALDEKLDAKTYKIRIIMENHQRLMSIATWLCLLVAPNPDVSVFYSEVGMGITIDTVPFTATEIKSNSLTLVVPKESSTNGKIPDALDTLNSILSDASCKFEMLLVNPEEETQSCEYKSLKRAIREKKKYVLNKGVRATKPLSCYKPFYSEGHRESTEGANVDETQNKRYDCFLAHECGVHEQVRDLRNKLVEKGFTVWFDGDQLGHQAGQTVNEQMERGIRQSNFVICCITSKYLERTENDSTNAGYEFHFAKNNVGVKRIIGVIFEDGLFGTKTWEESEVGRTLRDYYVLDFSPSTNADNDMGRLESQLRQYDVHLDVVQRTVDEKGVRNGDYWYSSLIGFSLPRFPFYKVTN